MLDLLDFLSQLWPDKDARLRRWQVMGLLVAVATFALFLAGWGIWALRGR